MRIDSTFLFYMNSMLLISLNDFLLLTREENKNEKSCLLIQVEIQGKESKRKGEEKKARMKK